MPVRVRALALVATLVIAVSSPSDAVEPVRLVTPTVYGTHLPGLGQPAADLAKRIKALSAGALTLDLKQPGQGVQITDILDQVSKGTVDSGFSAPSFWAAKMPAAALFAGFPFGPDARGYVDWFYAGNGRKLYQRMYDEAGYRLHVIPCAFGGGETGGWFAKEVRSPKDLEGLRMRIFGLGGRVMTRLGAVTVLVPAGAIADAFAKQEIDAAELYPPGVDRRQNLHGTVKLIYVPGWHQPETVLEMIVNKDRWDALDDRQQAIIETACEASMLQTLAASEEMERNALAAFTADGIRIEQWPDGVMAALRQAWDAVAKEESDKNAFFAAVLDDLRGFAAVAVPAAEEPEAQAGAGQPQAAGRRE